MIKKIKDFIHKISESRAYSSCYTFHEYEGDAVFSMCECDDLNCPYNVKKWETDKNEG